MTTALSAGIRPKPLENELPPHNSDKLPVTVFIAVKNEAVNLRKCLASLTGFQRVVMLDSNSSDDSNNVIQSFGRELVQFNYQGGYPKKRQWALNAVETDTPWVMFMDADEEMTPELEQEIKTELANPKCDAYMITKGFHFMGKKFRFGGFSHAALLLFKQGVARFERMEIQETSGMDMEVHERLVVQGTIGKIHHPLIHNDFKGLQAYIDRHNKYSSWEAAVREKLMHDDPACKEVTPRLFGNTQERRRWLKQLAMRIPFEPWCWFFYHYFLRFGLLEGRRGLIACQIRAQYISNVHAKLYERRLASKQQASE